MKKIFVKTGDQVKVISGSKKGMIGQVKSLNKKHGLACIVDQKIIEKDSFSKDVSFFFHISNLMNYDFRVKKASRIGSKFLNQKKYRYFKCSGNLVEEQIFPKNLLS
jgi:ribosomal protein L24